MGVWRDWFISVLWSVWKVRNQVCHDSSPWSRTHFWQVVQSFASELSSLRCTPISPTIVDLIGWAPPASGWVKMNTDGSVTTNPHSAAVGVVVRGENGGWIGGFCSWIGTQEILHTELRALRDGLSWVRLMGYRRVVVETDSLLAVQLLHSQDTASHPLEALIKDILQIVAEGWCEVKHIRREANFVADRLAKMGHAEKDGEKWFPSPPGEVAKLVEDDRKGAKYRRGATAAIHEFNASIGIG
ncbi:Putative ribonuclease H protein At1g65750 [Linum grandiflorum]